jgi:two-component system, probable response regulator PhcQ
MGDRNDGREVRKETEMDNVYDYKRFAILYVDDEVLALKSIKCLFEDHFRILTASSAREGLTLLEQHKDEIGILLTDQRMPGKEGGWLLEKARQLSPRIIRILITAYADNKATIAAVNTGAIYKYIEKPVDPVQLQDTLKRSLEFFMVQRERDQLLTEKMALLQNMMVADRMISFGLLTAGLSHHIRNPLVAVKTFLDLAPAKMEEEKAHLEGLRHPDFWREFHHNVQGQLDKIDNLLKDLWTASEKPAPQFADRVRLHEIVGETLARLKDALAAKDIQVENLVPDSLPILSVDRSRFHRLFELLLRDEIVSLPAGSQITLSATLLTGAQPDCEEIQVTVSDNGPGLPEETIRLVFDPFALRSDSPLEYGIHLMTCYFIVHHHGGRIAARSEVGEGTTFTLRLPTNPTRVPPSQRERQLLQKVQSSEPLWQELISSN